MRVALLFLALLASLAVSAQALLQPRGGPTVAPMQHRRLLNDPTSFAAAVSPNQHLMHTNSNGAIRPTHVNRMHQPQLLHVGGLGGYGLPPLPHRPPFGGFGGGGLIIVAAASGGSKKQQQVVQPVVVQPVRKVTVQPVVTVQTVVTPVMIDEYKEAPAQQVQAVVHRQKTVQTQPVQTKMRTMSEDQPTVSLMQPETQTLAHSSSAPEALEFHTASASSAVSHHSSSESSHDASNSHHSKADSADAKERDANKDDGFVHAMRRSFDEHGAELKRDWHRFTDALLGH